MIERRKLEAGGDTAPRSDAIPAPGDRGLICGGAALIAFCS
jgi:hypothetical protein